MIPLTELEQVTRKLHLLLERTGWCWYCGYRPTHVADCPVHAVAVVLAKLQASGEPVADVDSLRMNDVTEEEADAFMEALAAGDQGPEVTE